MVSLEHCANHIKITFQINRYLSLAKNKVQFPVIIVRIIFQLRLQKYDTSENDNKIHIVLHSLSHSCN